MKKLKSSPKPEKTVPKSPEIKRLEEVFRLMGSYGVGEVELEDKHGRVHVRMSNQPSSTPLATYSAPAPVVTGSTTSLSAPKSGGSEPALAPNQKQIASPFVGTFYRSSSPSAEPYVKDGQRTTDRPSISRP